MWTRGGRLRLCVVRLQLGSMLKDCAVDYAAPAMANAAKFLKALRSAMEAIKEAEVGRGAVCWGRVDV